MTGTVLALVQVMWIQASLTPSQLAPALDALLPMRVLLDDDQDADRCLWIDRPSAVTTSEAGLHVRTSGRLQWDVIGIKLPVVLRQVDLTIIPTIQAREQRDVLVFSLRLDAADLSALPGFVEASLLHHVNHELAKESAQVVWSFTRTLDFNFSLPKRIVGPRKIRLYAHQGAVKMSPEAIVLAAHFRVDVLTLDGAAERRPVPDDEQPSDDD